MWQRNKQVQLSACPTSPVLTGCWVAGSSLEDSFNLPSSVVTAPSTPAATSLGTRSRIPVRQPSSESLRSPPLNPQPVFRFHSAPRSPPRHRETTVGSSFDESAADFKSQPASRPSSQAPTPNSRPSSGRRSDCSSSVDERIAQLRAELGSRPRSSSRSRCSSATARKEASPAVVPPPSADHPSPQRPEDVLAKLFTNQPPAAVPPSAPVANHPQPLNLGGFRMADPDFLLNDDWRGSESADGSCPGSDVESHDASLRRDDVLTSLPGVQRTPRASFMLEREGSSMDPRKLLRGRQLDDDATSSTSSSTVVTTPSRLSQANM